MKSDHVPPELSTRLVLSVRHWDSTCESAESRKLKKLNWFPKSNNLSDPGFVTLMLQPKGPQFFAVYTTIQMLASDCKPRGRLVDGDGNPLDLDTIASVCRIPRKLLQESIEVMTSIVPWLAWESPIVPADSAGASGKSPGVPAASAGTPVTQDMEDKEEKKDSTSRTSRTGAVAVAAGEVSSKEWQRALPFADRIRTAFWPNSSLSDRARRWVAQIAILAVRRGEGLIAPALESARHSTPHDPVKFFGKIINDECQRIGTTLDREIALIQPPDSVLRRTAKSRPVSGSNGEGVALELAHFP